MSALYLTLADLVLLLHFAVVLFNVFGVGSTILGVMGSTPLAKRYGKRNVFIVGLALTVLFTAADVLGA